MPNINSLTYNGMKSTDLGVYVTGSGSFDAAEMDADKYEIAGRNGDLIIPKNRYKNIVVTYPAFIPKAFQEKAQSIRNWMRSAKAYARLEDTYDMEHYRLGLASGIQSFEPVNRNDASNFQLSFDCKPQRFLKTGETPLPIVPEAHTYSGEIVSFETVAVDDMTKAEVSLSPIQSLNGYDHPWAGGAGKNKALPYTDRVSDNGVTYTVTGDGVKVNGTATSTSYSFTGRQSYADSVIKLPAGTYTFSASAVPGASQYEGYLVFYGYTSSGTQVSNIVLAGTTLSKTVTFAEDVGINYGFVVVNGRTANVDSKIMIESGSTKTAFAPYENLCPITGHTGATLNVTGVNAWDGETEPGYIYNGTPYSDANYWRTKNYIPVKSNASYYIKGVTNNGQIALYDSSKTYVSSISSMGAPSYVVTIPENCHYIKFYQPVSVDANTVSVNYPSTDHDYHAYVGNQYTSSFGQTVYGGTFDFVSGKLVVEWANIASYNGETITEPWLSSMDVYSAGATPTTGAQVVYKLATPIEIDLDPTEVQTLLGLNNVWASDGTVEINYADPFNVDNPTYFEARPLFEITNPAQNDVLNVNGKTITFLSSYTGTVTIDCETMDCFSGYTNLNYLISATDFLVLNEGVNIVTWSGSGTCKMTPRWWEL